MIIKNDTVNIYIPSLRNREQLTLEQQEFELCRTMCTCMV